MELRRGGAVVVYRIKYVRLVVILSPLFAVLAVLVIKRFGNYIRARTNARMGRTRSFESSNKFGRLLKTRFVTRY